MDPNKDAYGQEVWQAYFNKSSYEAVERDDGYLGMSQGAPAYFAKFKNWPTIQRQAIKFVKGKCLDIGAGAGRVSLYLQQKGYDVIAIDNSPLAIKVCKKRGVKHARVLSIEKINTFKQGSFETIIMFGNNFGLFGSFKKARRLLTQLYKVTSPSALILTESNDIYKTNDPVHLAYHKLNRKRGRMAGQIRMRIRFEKYVGDWFDYLMVSPKEMRHILKGTGWKIKKVFSSKDKMYIAVLNKT